MSARILDGAAVAAAIRERVAGQVRELAARGVEPRLEVILVGDDPASRSYVGSKAKACQQVGIRSATHHLPAETGAEELSALIGRLNTDADVDGILLQLPLPKPLDGRAFLDLVDPSKDVDGLHPLNVGLLHQGRPAFVPCTPAGVIELIEGAGVRLAGCRAVVLGRSEIVGKPMAALLLARHATVTVCHSHTRGLDYLATDKAVDSKKVGSEGVSRYGKAALVTAEHVQSGAVVVDVGVNRVEDPALVARLYPGDAERQAQLAKRGYTLVGDVDFTQVREVAGAITPVPGGGGPLTIAGLLQNTVTAARRRRGL